jgi:hypothetical protein
MMRIACTHNGHQPDFVLEVPSVTLKSLRKLATKRLGLDSEHLIERIIAAAPPSARKGRSCWDGSMSEMRGGKWAGNPQLHGDFYVERRQNGSSSALEYHKELKHEDQWQKLVAETKEEAATISLQYASTNTFCAYTLATPALTIPSR